MSSPVVVSGTPVSNPAYASSSAPYASSAPTAAYGEGAGATTMTASPHGGEKQETRCNDPFFALLFYGCIAAIVAVAVVYGPAALDAQTNNSNVDYVPLVIYVIIVALVGFFVSAGGLAVMMCIPETLIKISLIFSVVMSGVWAGLAFASGQIGIGVMALIFFLISCCYAYAVWGRIPFATANLVTAITAVKANCGITIYAYVITIFGMLWSFCWSVAFVGVFDKTYVCDANNVCSNPNYGYLFLLFLAFFFGQQVFQYMIHVTVAGTVATWWYEPNDCGCCTSSINNSFIRTMTTSFGSICFGSFVVAVIQALRMLANSAQSNGDGNFLVCIAECLLACLASIIEYLNKWAFVYVGIYGFSYIKSAKSVFELFKNRGWDAIIADDLIANTLLLVSLISGAIIGAIGLLIQVTTGLVPDETLSSAEESNANIVIFVLGFFVGLTICSILMSVIGSGVNTIIVLFAEAPAEFQQNHPELSNRMRQVWSQVYPGSI